MTVDVATPVQIRARLSEFRQAVTQARRILIGTHLNPDGDAIGSALAVAHWLGHVGVEHELVCHNEAPGYLQFLHRADEFRREPLHDDHDMGIVCDLDAMERLGSCRPFFDALPFLAVIDHHIPHEAPGQLRIISTAAPATCAILADLFFEAPADEVDPVIAECLLTGIVTDTGSFRYPNTTPHAMRLAAWLVEKGANLARIASECYFNRDEAAVKLGAAAIDRMNLDMGGRLAWVAIPQDLYRQLGALEEHTEGIVNELLAIRSVAIAAVIRPGRDGKVKASLRSKGDIDVAAVARQIGGGGHKNAAGVTYIGTLADAERDIVEALRECLASYSSTSPTA